MWDCGIQAGNKSRHEFHEQVHEKAHCLKDDIHIHDRFCIGWRMQRFVLLHILSLLVMFFRSRLSSGSLFHDFRGMSLPLCTYFTRLGDDKDFHFGTKLFNLISRIAGQKYQSRLVQCRYPISRPLQSHSTSPCSTTTCHRPDPPIFSHHRQRKREDGSKANHESP
jgi:hypothetical protein